jgi:LPPG:FO 2-phospho-L-lactate transferase
MNAEREVVVALSGGIGGAKLALGLDRILPPGSLVVVANTGDDFTHLGLEISPDLDTLLYTLAGIDNPETGWGRRGDTWSFMAALERLGGETWFRLGDGDLAIHIERTRRLAGGESLSAITGDFCRRLGVSARLLPMTDDRVRTRLLTAEGWLDFQDYFVRRRARPAVSEIAFVGADRARPQPDFLAALRDGRLRAIVICPSNPFLSIDPILALPGVRTALERVRAPVIAVSPIVGKRALRGPSAKLMAELGFEIGARAVAGHYAGLLDHFIADEADREELSSLDLPVTLGRTVMNSVDDRKALARLVLSVAARER